MIKLVATDMDETLFDDKSNIPEGTVETIEALLDRESSG